MPGEICVLGSLNSDLVVQVARLPAAGETVLGLQSDVVPGGKGANQAAAAAALGGTVSMVGCIGADELGSWMRRDLAERGVDTSNIRVVENVRTGSATIPVAPDGSNLIVVDPGANSSVSAQDASRPAVVDAEVVLLQLEVPMLAVETAAREARGTVILNPAPYRELSRLTLTAVDLLVPNLFEFTDLVGAAAVPQSLDEAVALMALSHLPCSAVVTLGAEGALVRLRDSPRVVHVPAPQVEVVDTTGAGDCLCGALAVAVAEGADVVEGVRFAVTAASISTTGAGARGHLPSRGDVTDLAL
jgi:ribokinase